MPKKELFTFDGSAESLGLRPRGENLAEDL